VNTVCGRCSPALNVNYFDTRREEREEKTEKIKLWYHILIEAPADKLKLVPRKVKLGS
jgi:hypothetical protein